MTMGGSTIDVDLSSLSPASGYRMTPLGYPRISQQNTTNLYNEPPGFLQTNPLYETAKPISQRTAVGHFIGQFSTDILTSSSLVCMQCTRTYSTHRMTLH